MREDDFKQALEIKDEMNKLVEKIKRMSDLPKGGEHSFKYKVDIKECEAMNTLYFIADDEESRFLFDALLEKREARLLHLMLEFKKV